MPDKGKSYTRTDNRVETIFFFPSPPTKSFLNILQNRLTATPLAQRGQS